MPARWPRCRRWWPAPAWPCAARPRSIALVGVDLDRYDRIVGLRGKVVAGSARLAPGEAIIGRELAADLGVRVGDRLTVQSPAPVQRVTVRVTALVDLGVRELNRRTVIVPLRAAQSLLGLPGGATNLDLTWPTCGRAGLADRLRAQLALQGGELAGNQRAAGVGAERAVGQHRADPRVVLVVVVLGIASVLVVSVVQKRREIGILRAMGATRGQVLRICSCCRARGRRAGLGAGRVLAWLIWAVHTTSCAARTACRCFNITLPPGLALQVALMATVCGVLAAVAPARARPRWTRRRPSGCEGGRHPALIELGRGAQDATTSACPTRPRCCTACRCACSRASSRR
jgi:lipoprotein-releasing system permease protein